MSVSLPLSMSRPLPRLARPHVAAKAAEAAREGAISPIVDVNDLWAYYGATAALKSITMKVPRNSVVGLIGPSGCGKSTFLRTLNRMNDLVPGFSVKGQVMVEGTDIYGPDTDVVDLRRRVGMVFQRPNPFPMSIIDNVTWALRTMKGLSRRDVKDIAVDSLQRVGLWKEVKDRLKDPAISLSGGQQQRLCIARAIAVRPSILLMDEPTSALDPLSTNIVEDLISDLKQEYTVILVSHNIAQVGRVADYTAFFLSGELVEFGPTEELFQAPKDKRTEDYITGRFG